MSLIERIDSYLQGWVTGDISLLVAEAADDYYFDDPNRGRILMPAFEAYVEDIKAEAEAFRGGRPWDRFEDLSDIVVKEQADGSVIVWFWWAIAGTPVEGMSLVKADEAGVHSETICYYAPADYGKPPD